MAYEVGPVDATGEDEEAVQNPERQPHDRKAPSCNNVRDITLGFRDPLRSSRKTSSKYWLCHRAPKRELSAGGRKICLEIRPEAKAGRATLSEGLWAQSGGGLRIGGEDGSDRADESVLVEGLAEKPVRPL